MNAADLTRLVEQDLTGNAGALAWYGRPLAECLCQPERRVFLDSFNNNEPVHLWLVFNECTNDSAGYKVVYSEELQEFGLAVAGTGEPVLIGFYGGFVDTLNSM